MTVYAELHASPNRVRLIAPDELLTHTEARQLARRLAELAELALTAEAYPAAETDFGNYRAAGGTRDWTSWWDRYAADYQHPRR